MTREEFVLSVLSVSNGRAYTPVQIQKLFFLIDKKIGDKIGGPFFDFKPYHYGPFDKSIYSVLNNLIAEGLISMTHEGFNRREKYSLTVSGQREGERCINTFQEPYKSYIHTLEDFVTSLSFTELIKSIYSAYPETKVNSVFQS